MRSVLTFGLVFLIGTSTAAACEVGEQLRLSDEIDSLALKNAWAGVERKYEQLMADGCEVKVKTHNAGAESAQALGKTLEVWERLTAANAIEPNELLKARIDGIEANFGRVQIRGDARRRQELSRPTMPFAPDQRKSIEYAISVMDGTGSFKGMLPAGDYVVGDEAFTVKTYTNLSDAEKTERGETGFLTITLGKVRGGKEPDEGSGGGGAKVNDAGAIAWSGPIVLIGGGFFGSRAPDTYVAQKNPSYLINDSDYFPSADGTDPGLGAGMEFQEGADGSASGFVPSRIAPGDLEFASTAVLDLTLGYEVGLSYKGPDRGFMVVGNIRRTPTARYSQLTLHAAAVVRPGVLRFTLGPTYGMVVGRSQAQNALAPWVDIGPIVTDVAGEDHIQQTGPVKGRAWGGGIAGSGGAALIEIGNRYEGLVEVHGHWMRDDMRGYSGLGIRFGIVPRVTSRFED